MKKLLFSLGVLTMFLVATTMTSCGEKEATDEKTEVSEGKDGDNTCCENEGCTCKEDGKDCSKGDACGECGGEKSCSKDKKSCKKGDKECKKGDHKKCSKADMEACKKFCTEDCKDGEHSEECKMACKAHCDKEGKTCDMMDGEMKCEEGKCGDGAMSDSACNGGDMAEPTAE